MYDLVYHFTLIFTLCRIESEKKVHSNKRFILYSGNKFEFRSKDGAYQKIEGRCVFALLQQTSYLQQHLFPGRWCILRFWLQHPVQLSHRGWKKIAMSTILNICWSLRNNSMSGRGLSPRHKNMNFSLEIQYPFTTIMIWIRFLIDNM